MPWLKVHCEGALPLAATLVDISGSVVEHPQHWDQSVTDAIGAPNVAILGADFSDTQANATRLLADEGASFESLVDPVY